MEKHVSVVEETRTRSAPRSGFVQLAVEVDEPPYLGPGLKALPESENHVAITRVADRVSRSRGVRGNPRAAVPLARVGGSTT